jgi:polyvinyl alcohol dehydrogenase (cytochrome)
MSVLLVAFLASILSVRSGTVIAAADQRSDVDGSALYSLQDWPGWQKDLIGTRFNAFERTITASNVGNLKLKWAFVLPNPDNFNSGQPSVVGDTLFIGGRDAKLYALNAKTGATKWTYDVTAVSGPVDATHLDPLRDAPAVFDHKVIFGDTRGYLYEVDQTTGRLNWATKLSDHPSATMTSSPIIYKGRVYVGVSSSEEVAAANPSYPCCTFRGQLVSLDLNSGAIAWRDYTVPPSTQTGSSPNGTPIYGPSGAAVWSSPVVDPTSDTLFFATGNNYTGSVGDSDSVIAVSTATGAVKWKQQVTHPDAWTVGCALPGQSHCEGLADGTNLDFDFGATPNFFHIGSRLVIGIGQKSGVYHVFDARTGEVVWRQQLSVPKPNGGESGIQWGTSYDGTHIYVATWQADPGTLFALDPATGRIVWSHPNPPDGCATGGAVAYPNACTLSMMPAVSSTPGVVYEGSIDGKTRAFRSSDGALLWQYDTIRQYTGVNGLTASGGSISGNGGTVISHGMVYVQSGTTNFFGIPGRVLLAFGL